MNTPIWIYDKEENLVLTLNTYSKTIPYTEGWFDEELNGAITLDFTIPASDPKASMIENDGRAVIRTQDGDFVEFIIRRPEDENGRNGPIKRVYCEGGDYELIDEWMTGYKADNVTFATALSAVLGGTRWSPGNVDDFGTQSVNIEPTTVKNAVVQLFNLFGGERKYRISKTHNRITNRFIDALQKRGSYDGKRFEFGKDIDVIRRTPDSTGIKTALYGYGASGENDAPRLTFADVEWSKASGDPADKPLGQTYIGDPEALQKWGYEQGTRHRFGQYSGQEQDPAELLMSTWRELEKITKINTTYEASVYLLEKLAGYKHERVRLGDDVVVLDRVTQPNIEVGASVIKYRENLNDNQLDEVVIGAFRNVYDVAGKTSRLEEVVDRNKGKWDEKETPEGAQDKADNVFTESKKIIDDAMAEANSRLDAAQVEIDAAEADIAQTKIDLEAAKVRITDAEADLIAADGRIDETISNLDDAIVDLNNAQSLIDSVTRTENGVAMLDGKLVTSEIVANNATLTGTINGLNATIQNLETRYMTAINATMQNSTVTGTLNARDATFQSGTFNEAYIIDANIQDATITGQLNSASGTFTGELVGVDGTFTGSLTSVDGTFVGDLVGGRIYSDDITFVGSDLYVTNRLYLGDPYSSGSKLLKFDNNSLIRSGYGVAGLHISSSNTSITDGGVTLGSSGYNVTVNTDLRLPNRNVLEFSSYGGGWYMQDSDWIRAYASKDIYTGGTMKATTFDDTSSIEYKENIALYSDDAVNLIKSLPVYRYNYKKSYTPTNWRHRKTGFIIPEDKSEFPETLMGPSGDGVDIYAAIGVLWRANQQLIKRLETIENAG